jgi:flagellar biosynthesis protein FliR
MSICTNCALLAWLYDEEGKWKVEPGLAAILIMEHVLLLIKFGFSRLVPEVIVSSLDYIHINDSFHDRYVLREIRLTSRAGKFWLGQPAR